MRFSIELSCIDPDRKTLPINYQYELSSWIYHVLNEGNPDFARWLHDRGYMDSQKRFRLFTFSGLRIPDFRVSEDRLMIRSKSCSFILSMYPVEMAHTFIEGLFKDRKVVIGDKVSKVLMVVGKIESLCEPDSFNRCSFSTLSPLLVTYKPEDEKYVKYLSPDHPMYSDRMFSNLCEKWKAIRGEPFLINKNDVSMKVTSQPRKKGILIKAGTPDQTKVIGYQFDFTLTGPSELLRLGYYAGFGEKNRLGFGCVEVKK